MRGTTKKARERKEHDGRDKVTLPPEYRAEPAGQRNYDDTRHDVARRDPRDLVEARAEIVHHVRQRDVDDRAVDDLHERGKHHRERNEVLVRFAVRRRRRRQDAQRR